MLRCPGPTDLSRSGRLTGAGSVLRVRMLKEGHGRVKQALMMGLSVLYLCIYDFWFLRLKSLLLFFCSENQNHRPFLGLNVTLNLTGFRSRFLNLNFISIFKSHLTFRFSLGLFLIFI